MTPTHDTGATTSQDIYLGDFWGYPLGVVEGKQFDFTILEMGDDVVPRLLGNLNAIAISENRVLMISPRDDEVKADGELKTRARLLGVAEALESAFVIPSLIKFVSQPRLIESIGEEGDEEVSVEEESDTNTSVQNGGASPEEVEKPELIENPEHLIVHGNLRDAVRLLVETGYLSGSEPAMLFTALSKKVQRPNFAALSRWAECDNE